MNTNQEGFPSEDERVASFMQALQRMHEDPAEAARIELIIEEAEASPDAREVGDGQPLVFHIHNEGRLNFTAPQQVVEPKSAEPGVSVPSERRTEPKRSFLTAASTAASFPLVLMAFVVVFSMQDGRSSGWVSAAMSVVFSITAAALSFAFTRSDRDRRQGSLRGSLVRKGDRARELNRH
ncbi:hypothetical protein [Streptomyces sp. NPDC088812]|uniref:hypothetical protein n=1 Tax=Streptomyces sp. NPDC088812 TaxID=3365905 RepID=UPI00382D9193